MFFISKFLSKTKAIIDFIFDLSFLPDKLQTIIFSTGTRGIEILSSLVMLGFAFVFYISGNEISHEDLYSKFQHIHPHVVVCVLTVTAILQLYAAIYQSSKSNIWSGWLLIWSALVWFVITGIFWAAYPPLSTGMSTYLVFAVFCGLAGRSLIRHTKHLEDKKKNKKGGQ